MLSVKQQQLNLKHYMGYYGGKIDGKFGPQTKTAIKSFQSGHGLSADGIWGKNTESKMLSVVKNIQNALKVKADGLIGNNTINAIKNFQKLKGLKVDGIAGKQTLDKLLNKPTTSSIYAEWSKYKYISKSEMKCKCGGKYCNGYPVEAYASLINIAEKLRIKYGKPIYINSGIRCKQHNANVGGVYNSKHLSGRAIDCYINGVSGSALKNAAYSLGAKYAYVISGNAVHFDV